MGEQSPFFYAYFLALVFLAMGLDFWTKTSGTWINIATVLAGTGLGLLLRDWG